MIKRFPGHVMPSEITPRALYMKRREFVAGALAAGLIGSTFPRSADAASEELEAAKSPYSTGEELTPLRDIRSYNNFVEFGPSKGDPAARAREMTLRPWTVKIDGLVRKPADYDVDDLIKTSALEERIYRMRCVEAWSMVIPWIGFPLADLLKRVEPLGSAKYVKFETLVRPKEMAGQRGLVKTLDWPYVEGLRLDEAMHPLTILAVGLYGETLPHQNGAPIRLVVPWKYGFKSIKSVVRISFTEKEPATSWNLKAPNEYGFYANVNPDVDHPRWSQKRERRIGKGGLFVEKQPTMMFNGYAEEVASLYTGLDLKANF